MDVSETRRPRQLADESAQAEGAAGRPYAGYAGLARASAEIGGLHREAEVVAHTRGLRSDKCPLVAEFGHGQSGNGRHFQILNISKDVTQECPATIPDSSNGGRQVAK